MKPVNALFEGVDDPPEPFEFSIYELHDALKLLTARQRFVIELRYGLRDGNCYTQREIAELMGLNHKTVVEHEQAAISRLDSALNPPKSSPCLDTRA